VIYVKDRKGEIEFQIHESELKEIRSFKSWRRIRGRSRIFNIITSQLHNNIVDTKDE
jgi:hypothetical protein